MGANYGCAGTFHFLEQKENLLVELDAVAVEFLHFSRGKKCAKGEKTGAELIVEQGLV